MALEKMDDFFTARVEGYDEHMIANVEGCREAYPKVAKLVPHGAQTLLDLGCGTGLELDHIFRLYPQIAVTGIDLTQAMLDKLRKKASGQSASSHLRRLFYGGFRQRVFRLCSLV